MQRERFSESAEYFSRLEEYKEIQRVTRDISTKVNSAINDLLQERRLCTSVARRAEYLHMSTRIARLERLLGQLLSMAEGNWDGGQIELDNPQFHQEMEGMTRINPNFFGSLKPNDIRNTIKSAEVIATDFLLSTLVPEMITNENTRVNYFLPFRKDLLGKTGDATTELEYGLEELALMTRLPNIEVAHVYPFGDQAVPLRFIRPKSQKD